MQIASLFLLIPESPHIFCKEKQDLLSTKGIFVVEIDAFLSFEEPNLLAMCNSWFGRCKIVVENATDTWFYGFCVCSSVKLIK